MKGRSSAWSILTIEFSKRSYIVEDHFVLFDELVAVLAVIEVDQHVCQVVLELCVLLRSHLLYFLSVHR
jgi:hypothetical protein